MVSLTVPASWLTSNATLTHSWTRSSTHTTKSQHASPNNQVAIEDIRVAWRVFRCFFGFLDTLGLSFVEYGGSCVTCATWSASVTAKTSSVASADTFKSASTGNLSSSSSGASSSLSESGESRPPIRFFSPILRVFPQLQQGIYWGTWTSLRPSPQRLEARWRSSWWRWSRITINSDMEPPNTIVGVYHHRYVCCCQFYHQCTHTRYTYLFLHSFSSIENPIYQSKLN